MALEPNSVHSKAANGIARQLCSSHSPHKHRLSYSHNSHHTTVLEPYSRQSSHREVVTQVDIVPANQKTHTTLSVCCSACALSTRKLMRVARTSCAALIAIWHLSKSPRTRQMYGEQSAHIIVVIPQHWRGTMAQRNALHSPRAQQAHGTPVTPSNPSTLLTAKLKAPPHSYRMSNQSQAPPANQSTCLGLGCGVNPKP